MIINIDISRRILDISDEEQSLAQGAVKRERLRNDFLSLLNSKPDYVPMPTVKVHESTMTLMITKYSEQLVCQPMSEIRYWFTYASGGFILPGYPPLYYSRTKNRAVSPNKSAVAAVGEGVAGLLSQRIYRCRMLARPNHDYPDIVMETSGNQQGQSYAPSTTYLVEAKATLSASNLEGLVNTYLPELVNYVSACKGLDKRQVRGLLVGTQINSETDYRCCVTEVRV